jgi:hypothetical protein
LAAGSSKEFASGSDCLPPCFPTHGFPLSPEPHSDYRLSTRQSEARPRAVVGRIEPPSSQTSVRPTTQLAWGYCPPPPGEGCDDSLVLNIPKIDLVEVFIDLFEAENLKSGKKALMVFGFATRNIETALSTTFQPAPCIPPAMLPDLKKVYVAPAAASGNQNQFRSSSGNYAYRFLCSPVLTLRPCLRHRRRRSRSFTASLSGVRFFDGRPHAQLNRLSSPNMAGTAAHSHEFVRDP